MELSTCRLLAASHFHGCKQRSRTYHLVDLLRYPVAEAGGILLDLLDGGAEVIPQLLGGEPELSDRHSYNTVSFSVDGTTTQHLHSHPDVFDDCAHLHAGHQASGTENSTQSCLVHSGNTVGVAETPVELDPAGLHGLKDLVFTDQHRSSVSGLLLVLGSRWTDDANSGLRLDGMGESEHISDDRTVLLGLQSDVDFVFRHGAFPANFECTDVPR